MRLKEVKKWLDDVFRGYDDADDESNNGIQVEGSSEVKKIAFAVDACMATIQEAADNGADMLIVHHGLSWKDDPKKLSGIAAIRLSKLIDNGITLYGMHLPLDAHDEIGNNVVLAKKLGFTDTEKFYDYHGVCIGRICSKEHETKLSDLLSKVKSKVASDAKLADNTNGVFKRAAFISGGGNFDFEKIAEAGADCLVTGEFRHKWANEAREAGVSIIAAGHYATEDTGIRALMAKTAAELPVETFFIEAPTGA